jgi:alkylation response protein AidB-like acyl-CoA dehydrogenase
LQLIDQLIWGCEIGGGQGDESAYQVSLGNSAAEQPRISGGLAKSVAARASRTVICWCRWCFGGPKASVEAPTAVDAGRLVEQFLALVAGVCGPVGQELSFLSVVRIMV